MLKLFGTVLVLFSCTALGWGKSMTLQKRLDQLREIEKIVHLLLGEITYRKETLPEALVRTSQKTVPPFDEFLQEVSRQASLFQGECFSKIFKETAQHCLGNSALKRKDLEVFVQLGEYLGWMDITLQKNTIALYLEQLKQEIQSLEKELPGRKKMCQSLGVMAGIFLTILCL